MIPFHIILTIKIVESSFATKIYILRSKYPRRANQKLDNGSGFYTTNPGCTFQ